MTVSKRLRFEILRRDNHACRYCGRSAPEVVLTVDHVHPVALGGGDDPTNLVAACKDCNSGKTSISPDAPLVADVRADALRWARAIELVFSQRETDRQVLNTVRAQFRERWTNQYKNYSGQDPWGSDWPDLVGRMLQAGFDEEDLYEFADKAWRKDGLSYAARWSYFCGCCYRTLEQVQAEARADLDVDDRWEEEKRRRALEAADF